MKDFFDRCKQWWMRDIEATARTQTTEIVSALETNSRNSEAARKEVIDAIDLLRKRLVNAAKTDNDQLSATIVEALDLHRARTVRNAKSLSIENASSISQALDLHRKRVVRSLTTAIEESTSTVVGETRAQNRALISAIERQTSMLTYQFSAQMGYFATGRPPLVLQEATFEALIRSSRDHSHVRDAITVNMERIFVEILKQEKPKLTIEIGAHEAHFSSMVKENLPDTRTVAFEANPNVHGYHHNRLHDEGVEYLNAAVSNSPGALTLKVPVPEGGKPNELMGSLLTYNGATSDETMEFQEIAINGVTVDGFLAGAPIEDLALWVDVEGAAAMVLEGAASTLSSCLCLYMEIEKQSRWGDQDDEAAAVEKMLATYGLTPVFRDVYRYGWQHNVIYLRQDLLERDYLPALYSQHMLFTPPIKSAAK